MSFAARARMQRENGGAFVFPEFEGWTRLKAWKFSLSKSKNPMFTLELKIIEQGDLKGKIVKQRTVISPKADWQFDAFLVYLEDSGIDLNGLDDKDPNFQDIQDALEYLEDKGQKVKVHLVPQKDDARYYNLRFIEVEKVGEGAGGPVVDDPADDEETAPPAASAPAVTTSAPPVEEKAPEPARNEAPARKKKPWEK